MYVHRMTQGRHGRSWKSNATNVQMSPLKHVSAEFSLTDPNPQNILYPVSMYIYIYMDSILLVSHHFSLDLLQTHPPGNDHISHLRESRKIIDSKVPLKGDMLVPSRERCLEKKFVQKIFSQVVVNDGDSPMGFWAVKESQKKKTNPNLVGGFNPSEKYWSKWVHLPQIGVKIKKYLKFHHQEMSPLKKMGQQKFYWSKSLMYSGYYGPGRYYTS